MSTRKKIKNVFEAILEYGHDEDFVPYEGETFIATDAHSNVGLLDHWNIVRSIPNCQRQRSPHRFVQGRFGDHSNQQRLLLWTYPGTKRIKKSQQSQMNNNKEPVLMTSK